jgi:hypothetical protein
MHRARLVARKIHRQHRGVPWGRESQGTPRLSLGYLMYTATLKTFLLTLGVSCQNGRRMVHGVANE